MHFLSGYNSRHFPTQHAEELRVAQFWKSRPSKTRKIWSLYRGDREFRRFVRLLFWILAPSLAEILLFAFVLRQHAQKLRDYFALHRFITLTLMLLPIMAMAFLIQLPFVHDWRSYTRRVRERYRNESLFRRHARLIFGSLTASLGEIALLAYDLRQKSHGATHRLVLHPLVTVGLVFLPVMMWCLIVRLPFARRLFKNRYSIRPFATISTNPALDGSAIATLFYRELLVWQSRAAAGSVEDRFLAPQSPTITLGYASFTLNWLWTKLRFPLVGRENVIVGGVLLDKEEPHRLTVWTSAAPGRWEELLDEDIPAAQALDAAIYHLVPLVLECVDPIQAANIYELRWKYQDAVRLRSKEAYSDDDKVDLARTLIDGEHHQKAAKILDKLDTKRSRRQRKIDRLRGTLQLNQGEYGKARDSLTKALACCDDKKTNEATGFDEATWIARSLTYEGEYSQALDEYDRAWSLTWKELDRLVGETVSGLHDIDSSNFPEDRGYEVNAVVWNLQEIAKERSVCHQRLHQYPEVLDRLDQALRILDVISNLGLSEIRELQTQRGEILEAIALHLKHRPDDANSSSLIPTKRTFDSEIAAAIEYYSDAVNDCKRQSESSQDDTSMLARCAWAHLGLASTLLWRIDGTGLQLSDHRLTRIRLLYEIADELLEPSQTAFKEHFLRACELFPSNRKEADEHVQGAGSQISEGLKDKAFLKLLHIKEKSNEGDVKEEIGEIELPPSTLPPEAYENARRLGLLTADLNRIQTWVHGLLSSLLRNSEDVAPGADVSETAEEPSEHNMSVDEEKAADSQMEQSPASDRVVENGKDSLWNCASDLNRMTKSLNTADQLFTHLCGSSEPRSRGEGWYGKACLNAILGDHLAARDCIGNACVTSLSYLNRAVLDPDVDNIRSNPEFLLLWGQFASKIAREGDVAAKQADDNLVSVQQPGAQELALSEVEETTVTSNR
jgi:tetratricopeptide (TPR) repeat protein